MKKKKRKLSDSELAARTRLERAKLEFVEKHGTNKVKETFFKKYLDNGIFYIAMNFAFWYGLLFLTSKCSD